MVQVLTCSEVRFFLLISSHLYVFQCCNILHVALIEVHTFFFLGISYSSNVMDEDDLEINDVCVC